MAKNLVNGTNIIIEEGGDNINMNLSSSYTSNLNQSITDSFKNNNVYSTTETIIGKWIDDKPIYRKVYTGDLGEATISHGLTNFKIVKIYGIFFNPNSGNWFPLPSTRPTYPEYEVGIYVGSTYINLERGSGAQSSNMTFEIVLEYIKTTD